MLAAEVLLLGEPRSASAARRFVAAILSDWKATGYDDIALLLVSELVTNAALHARTEVRVRVQLNDLCLRLEVTDLSPRQPVVRHYSSDATTGRGLGMVESLARSWGIDARPDGGKTVWAEVVPGSRPARRVEGDVVVLSAFPDLDDEGLGTDGPAGSVALARAA